MPIRIGGLELFSVTELAKALKVKEETIRDYLRRGLLPGNRIGTRWYVSADALKEYWSGRRKGPRKRKNK